LTKSLQDFLYLNCDLPSSQELLKNVESFYRGVNHSGVILDEVHQLPNPSLFLKIGTDEFSHLKILATGSSTLSATTKFRDSLTGRKTEIHLLPVLESECASFGVKDIRKRLLLGGFPEVLLSQKKDPGFFSEWMASFYARDIQELFHVEKRQNFLLLLEWIFRQSGGLFEITSLSKHCGVARLTISKYLEILQITHAIRVLRPYHGGGRQELIQQPKIYGFDTGIVAHCKGWNDLQEENCGLLWEHLVLHELMSRFSHIFYWRNKQKQEVDFILPGEREKSLAIECKWNPDAFNIQGMKTFRENHPLGENVLLSPHVIKPYIRNYGKLKVLFSNLSHFMHSRK
jgi:predicted AAA+ superfamily ATPase